MYIKSECPFCRDAIKLLKKKQEDYEIIDLSEQEQVWEEIKMAYGWNTVPMILSKEGKFLVLVGGYTDLKEYLEPSEG